MGEDREQATDQCPTPTVEAGRPAAPQQHAATGDERDRDTQPDRSASQRGGERCSRCAQEQSALGEPASGPLGDQGEADHCEGQRPQLGLVVDRDPAGGEQSRGERNRRGEEPQRPTIVDRIRGRRRPDHRTAGASQSRRPPAEHHDGDQHRHAHQPADEQIAEEHQRHPHQREEGPVVQVGLATHHEALGARDRRIDRQSAVPERSRLLVVEVGTEPCAIEQLPRTPRCGHQPEDGDGDYRDDPHHGVGRQPLVRRFAAVAAGRGGGARLGSVLEIPGRRHVTSRAGRAGAALFRVEPRTGRRTVSARFGAPDRRRRPRRSRALPRRRVRRAAARRRTRWW